jgi:hypothetical protein
MRPGSRRVCWSAIRASSALTIRTRRSLRKAAASTSTPTHLTQLSHPGHRQRGSDPQASAACRPAGWPRHVGRLPATGQTRNARGPQQRRPRAAVAGDRSHSHPDRRSCPGVGRRSAADRPVTVRTSAARHLAWPTRQCRSLRPAWRWTSWRVCTRTTVHPGGIVRRCPRAHPDRRAPLPRPRRIGRPLRCGAWVTWPHSATEV